MKTENSKNERLEKKRTILFQIGVVVSLALVLLAFEWKTPKPYIKAYDWESKEIVEEEIISISTPKEKLVMPLPKVIQVFVEIDNKEDTDETLEFTFDNVEDGFNEPDLYVEYKQDEIIPEDTTIYDYPTKYPEFPGGESEMFRYLSKNIHFTEEAKAINLDGTVHVSFVVWKDGSIRDVQILRGLGAGLDEIVINVIQGMPDWNPGMQHGKNVNVRYRIPVKFSLK